MAIHPHERSWSLGGDGLQDPRYLTPDEHAALIEDAMLRLVPLTLSEAFQAAVKPSDPEAPLSLYAIYPDQRDASSALRREAAQALNRYNFVVKDGDRLPDYETYVRREFMVCDNRFDRCVPAGAIVAESRTPGIELRSLIALKKNWGLEVEDVIRNTFEPDGSPLPDLLSDEVQEKMWDVSLVSILPPHRAGAENDIRELGVLNVLYNGVLRAAEAEGVDRLIATLDIRVFKPLQRLGGHWHILEGVTPKPYESHVVDENGNPSNISVVATVNLPKWRADMAKRQPAIEKKLWGHVLQNRGVEYVGLRPPNLYDVMYENPNLSVREIEKLNVQTPALVMDLGMVETRYKELTNAFPGWRFHYATKANSDPPLLTWLHALGAGFEVASARELQILEDVGVDAAEALFTNPVTPPEDIEYAYNAGLDRFSFSSLSALKRIARHAPGSKVFVRLAAHDEQTAGAASQSVVPSEGKFGVKSIERATELMLAAGDLGLEAYGIAFHVGSQMERPNAWERALKRCAAVMTRLAAADTYISMVDAGGGLPGGLHRDGLLTYKEYAFAINRAIMQLPYRPKEFIMEPGRAIAEDGVLVTRVLEVNRETAIAQVYTDLGYLLLEPGQTGHTFPYPVTDSRQSAERMPANLWPGTCDSGDFIGYYPNALSANLNEGDLVLIHSTGAYSTAYASDFNGLRKPTTYYVGPTLHSQSFVQPSTNIAQHIRAVRANKHGLVIAHGPNGYGIWNQAA